MLRRSGNDKNYRTTYLSGVRWQREQRKMGLFRRIFLSIAAFFSLVVSVVAGLFGRLADVASGSSPSVQGLHENTLQKEPVTSGALISRRMHGHHHAPQDIGTMRRILLLCLALVLVVSGIIAIPSAKLLTASSTVSLQDEQLGVEVVTTASTVGELLDVYGVRLMVGDIVYPDRTQPLKNGTSIRIRRAMSITTVSDGVEKDLRIQAGTVRDALALSGIQYDADDIISPGLNTTLLPGLVIGVTRVTYETVLESQRLYYREIIQKDKSLYIGQTEVAQKGSEGEKELEIRIVYHDGEEYARQTVNERIVQAPVHLIVKEGTKEKPKATPKATATPTVNASANVKAQSVAASYKVNKFWVLHGDKKYEILEKATFMITAYTHTGRKTSTGTWPKVGTIAVDPKVIPYGTLLYVPGYGIGKASDTGPSNKHIDLFFDTYEECIKYGRQRNKTIYIIGKAQKND